MSNLPLGKPARPGNKCSRSGKKISKTSPFRLTRVCLDFSHLSQATPSRTPPHLLVRQPHSGFLLKGTTQNAARVLFPTQGSLRDLSVLS